LENQHAWDWVSGRQAVELQRMLVPADPDLMMAYPVGAFVNSPMAESEVCREPVPDLFR